MGEGLFITSYEFFHNIYQLQNGDVLRILSDTAEERHLSKGDFIVKTGEIQTDVYFMESGILRGFFIGVDGREQTDCIRNQCGTVAMSFGELMPVPSQMSIEILEGGNFFTIPMLILNSLQDNYLEVAHFYNRLLIAALNEHLEQKRAVIQYDTFRRYQWFIEKFPGVIERINNKYVASFLDMAPETLSRLRSAHRKENPSDEM